MRKTKLVKSKLTNNPVDHPSHYTTHPSGIEAIEVCGRMGFCTGNAFKYVFRFKNKWSPLEDLKKAIWYIDREAFQRGVSTKDKPTVSSRVLAAHWRVERVKTGELIDRIVGSRPGNAEKALFYIWLADNNSENGTFLLLARAHINKKILELKKVK